jgi:hypothetical protein
MQTQARKSGAIFKASEGQFVCCNEAKADKRNRQGVSMKQRDAEQGQRKQEEFEWNSEDGDWLGQFHLGQFLTDPNFPRFRCNKSTVAPEAIAALLCPLWVISARFAAKVDICPAKAMSALPLAQAA